VKGDGDGRKGAPASSDGAMDGVTDGEREGVTRIPNRGEVDGARRTGGTTLPNDTPVEAVTALLVDEGAGEVLP